MTDAAFRVRAGPYDTERDALTASRWLGYDWIITESKNRHWLAETEP